MKEQQQQPLHYTSNAPPQEFICPLTLELMIHPVVNRNGNCYEKAALIEWLSQPNATCPLTRQPIRLSDFIQDIKLERTIRDWRLQHGGDELSQTEETSSTVDDFGSNGDSFLFVRAPSLLAERTAAISKRSTFFRRFKGPRLMLRRTRRAL